MDADEGAYACVFIGANHISVPLNVASEMMNAKHGDVAVIDPQHGRLHAGAMYLAAHKDDPQGYRLWRSLQLHDGLLRLEHDYGMLDMFGDLHVIGEVVVLLRPNWRV